MAVLSIVGFGSRDRRARAVAGRRVGLSRSRSTAGRSMTGSTATPTRVGSSSSWHSATSGGPASSSASPGCVLVPLTAWICAGLAHGQARLARSAARAGLGRASRERADPDAGRDGRRADLRAPSDRARPPRRRAGENGGGDARPRTREGEARKRSRAAARELVEAAHAEATTAIVELRQLVAGIAPAVLTDRGLDAALSSLVATCRVPVTVDVQLPARLPMAVETAAYFVVAEALTNLQKHAGATQASSSRSACRADDSWSRSETTVVAAQIQPAPVSRGCVTGSPPSTARSWS